ncbi:hypothetical protein PG994_014266 [Apiospora phragmitis]|uniref:Nucleosome assembly protein n=1 Tax=Apiospora phragmitis TaxID=2905665 RepID=A0ABR1T3U2_9PEZI
MAANISEETLKVSYEQLSDLEKEFEENEVEIIRHQVALNKPLYEKREKILSELPGFWPLVLEQAPPDVDQYIQPSDSAVLLSSLKNLTVSHFEIDNGGKGDPRSIAIRLEFNENEYFEDAVLEKKLWHRRAKSGWTGLVSEPVPIRWKKPGKDLTQGLLDLVVKVWEEDKKRGPGAAPITKAKDYTPAQKELKKKIETVSMGGVSFFGWFGFRGFPISEEESRAATAKDRENRRLRAEGKAVPDDEDDEEDEDEDEDDDPYGLEIFPDGDELAIAISEDLWPSAIKYFTSAQETGDMSDIDFEDGMDEDDEDEEEEEEEAKGGKEPPAKKRKA